MSIQRIAQRGNKILSSRLPKPLIALMLLGYSILFCLYLIGMCGQMLLWGIKDTYEYFLLKYKRK